MTGARIQLRRSYGWRMPVGAIVVGRGTKWGNPHRVGVEAKNNAEAVALYREHLEQHPELVAAARAELHGKTLACWCAIDEPCHADVLLEIANGDAP